MNRRLSRYERSSYTTTKLDSIETDLNKSFNLNRTLKTQNKVQTVLQNKGLKHSIMNF